MIQHKHYCSCLQLKAICDLVILKLVETQALLLMFTAGYLINTGVICLMSCSGDSWYKASLLLLPRLASGTHRHYCPCGISSCVTHRHYCPCNRVGPRIAHRHYCPCVLLEDFSFDLRLEYPVSQWCQSCHILVWSLWKV